MSRDRDDDRGGGRGGQSKKLESAVTIPSTSKDGFEVEVTVFRGDKPAKDIPVTVALSGDAVVGRAQRTTEEGIVLHTFKIPGGFNVPVEIEITILGGGVKKQTISPEPQSKAKKVPKLKAERTGENEIVSPDATVVEYQYFFLLYDRDSRESMSGLLHFSVRQAGPKVPNSMVYESYTNPGVLIKDKAFFEDRVPEGGVLKGILRVTKGTAVDIVLDGYSSQIVDELYLPGPRQATRRVGGFFHGWE